MFLARSVARSGLLPVSTRDNARGEKTRAGAQKKWPLRGAAKFREETPRKGGGFAIKDRNTALQQYAGKTICLQAPNNISR